jgi:hypothetical protein
MPARKLRTVSLAVVLASSVFLLTSAEARAAGGGVSRAASGHFSLDVGHGLYALLLQLFGDIAGSLDPNG